MNIRAEYQNSDTNSDVADTDAVIRIELQINIFRNRLTG